MHVRDAMVTNPLIIPPEASLVDFIHRVLATNQTTAVIVAADGHLRGVVSVYDIFRFTVPHYVDGLLARVVTHGYFEERFARFARTRVDQVMVTDVNTVAPDDDIIEAAALIVRYAHKSVPVVDGTRFVGVVTRRSILRRVTEAVERGENPDGGS